MVNHEAETRKLQQIADIVQSVWTLDSSSEPQAFTDAIIAIRDVLKSEPAAESLGAVSSSPSTPESEKRPQIADDCGLSIDMLDVDRLREWARLLLVHGADISHWGSVPHVASKMQILATSIEKAVRDIGELRKLASLSGEATPSAATPTDAEVNAAINELAERAKRGITSTSGHAWGKAAEVDRLADLLKKGLADPVSPSLDQEKRND